MKSNTTTHLPDLKGEQSEFEMLYIAAKTKNKEKLLHALSLALVDVREGKNNVPHKLGTENDIDSIIFLTNYTSPTMVIESAIKGLVKTGYFQSAIQLLELKKNIIPEAYILAYFAYGYAYSGNTESAYECLETVKNKHSNTLASILYQIAMGFAEGNIIPLAYEFLEKAEKQFPANLDQVLRGLALGFSIGQNIVEIKILLNEINKKYASKIGDILSIIATQLPIYQFEGNIYKYSKQLIKAYPSYSFVIIITSLAFGFAYSGKKAETYRFLDRMTQIYPFSSEKILANAACGFIYSGYKAEIYAFLDRVVNHYPHDLSFILNSIAQYFLKRNCNNEAFAFLKKVEIEHPNEIANIITNIVITFLNAGENSEAGALLEKVNREHPDKLSFVLRHSLKRKTTQGNIEKLFILKALMNIKSIESRLTLANELKPYITAYDPCKLIDYTQECDWLMERKKITYNQFCGWIQPETQIFLLQGLKSENIQKLPIELFLYIATFLSPMPSSEMRDLYNKFNFEIYSPIFFKRHQSSLLTADIFNDASHQSNINPAKRKFRE